MAKKEKRQSEDDGHGIAAFRGNGFAPEIVQGFVGRIENLYGDLASLKGEFMAECKKVHDDVTEVLKEAKAAGIPKKALKSVLKTRKLQRDIDEVRADLEGEDQDSFDQLVVALGDFANTGLGTSAVERAAA